MTAVGWALLAALIWGVVPVFEKIGLHRVQPLPGLFYRCIGVMVGLVALAIWLVKPAEIRQVDTRSAALLILGGFLASVAAQICFYSGLKAGEMSRVVSIAASYPLITFLLGVLLLGESLTPLKAAGAFLIVGGIWLLKSG
ncbi:MAG: hypothetical protein MOGMAGMI_00636 [Candidatus Omnitrophica bacterium]|nr:hypothetical protein [Candidatus Omnitrophota bacterium]